MRKDIDKISQKILEILSKIDAPLESQELMSMLKGVTRIKLIYRLNLLRGDGLLKGKPVGCGKGSWIWWSNEAFKQNK